jgi:hypothetical protein
MEQRLLPNPARGRLGEHSGLDPASAGFAHPLSGGEVSNFEQSHDGVCLRFETQTETMKFVPLKLCESAAVVRLNDYPLQPSDC